MLLFDRPKNVALGVVKKNGTHGVSLLVDVHPMKMKRMQEVVVREEGEREKEVESCMGRE